MSITKFSIEHATAVFVLMLCLFIGGLISYKGLPREASPDVAIPIVIVSTPYFGVSPSDIEVLITQPIEKEFKSLRSVKQMTSTSAESVSLVTVEFETGVNIEDALQKIREKIDKVKPDLPVDAEDSEVIEINASDWPVLIANVSGDMDLARLKEIGEELQDELEKITGVLRVDLSGGVEREIQIDIDPYKMRHYGITANQVISAVQTENLNLPGGSIAVGSMKYLLRVPGEFQDMETIRNVVVKAPEGQPILLRDIATVRDGFKEVETYSRLTTFVTGPNGERVAKTMPNISLSVIKRAGENIIDIATLARGVISEYQGRMGEGGIEVSILTDMSKDIQASVHDLENNIISGMLLVLATLFFFMGGARNALMVAISIPLSMLVTFIVLDAMGITLNMVVLFSLILALGMLVDNAIVIVENVYRHASEGKSIPQAALDGTNEVGWAVISSTATTVGAFLPMVFWPGVMGEFMGYLPKTVIVTLLSSLFVALIINPTVCAVFMKVKPGEAVDEMAVPDNRAYRAYASVLEWSLNHRIIIVLLSVGTLIGSFVAFGMFNKGVEFFPGGTPETFTITVQTADGSRLEMTDEIVQELAKALRGEADLSFLPEAERERVQRDLTEGLKDVDAWVEDVGVGGGQGMTAGGRAPHFAKITVDLKAAEEQTGDPTALMAALRTIYQRVPGANIVLEKPAMGPPAGKAVNVELVGKDLAVMSQLAAQVRGELSTIPGVIDLSTDAELSRPELVVRVNRERAALEGLSTQAIASMVRTAFNGTKASSFRDGKDEYDITVRLPEAQRQRVEELEMLTIPNKDGVHIPLSTVASIDVQGGAGSIRHKDQERVVSISGNAAEGFLPAALIQQAQTQLAEMTLPPGYSIRFTGETEDQKEAGEFLGRALLIALFLIMLILVTQFNSISQPLIILSSVILSLIGVLWALLLYQMPFGIIMTGIGVISLAGVVVNNAIVLIDFANQLQRRGLTRREAVRTAGMVRLRPVLLTAVTTVLGFFPLVIGVSIDFVNQQIVVGGRSVDMWGPMAKAVSGGLIVATILTLLVVPVLYSLMDDVAKLTTRLFGGRRGAAAAPLKPSEEEAPSQDEAAEDDSKGVDGGLTARTIATGGAILLAIGASLALMLAPGVVQAQQPPAQPQAEQPAQPPAQPTPRQPDAQTPPSQPSGSPAYSVPGDLITQPLERAPLDMKAMQIPTTRTLTLEQARELGRKNSLDVQIAMTNIQVADATISKGYSALLPTLSAAFSTTIYDSEIAFAAAPGAPSAVVRPRVDWRASATAAMRLNPRAWPLLQIAFMNKDLSEQQIGVVKDELDFAVTQSFYNLLLLRQVMELVAQRLVTDRTTLMANERQREAGVLKPYELTRARIRVSQTENELEAARLQFIQGRLALAQILQTPADFDVAPAPQVAEPKSVDALKQLAKQQRRSLLVQRQGAAIADKQLEEIYWQYLPTVALDFTTFRPRATVFSPGEWQWSLGITAQWVLWDGGMREADLDERRAQLLAQQLKIRQAEMNLDAELEQAWSGYESAQTQLEGTREQVKLAQEGLEESQRAFALGAALQLDVLFAEDQLRIAQLAVLQDELRLQLAIRRLSYLSGEP